MCTHYTCTCTCVYLWRGVRVVRWLLAGHQIGGGAMLDGNSRRSGVVEVGSGRGCRRGRGGGGGGGGGGEV